jgi:hypothetical protein
METAVVLYCSAALQYDSLRGLPKENDCVVTSGKKTVCLIRTHIPIDYFSLQPAAMVTRTNGTDV